MTYKTCAKLALAAVFAASFAGGFLACKKKKDEPATGTNDASAPTVSNTTAACGTTATGAVTLTATASDNAAVTKVEFLVDGSLIDTDTTEPYSISWDITGDASGARAITAKAYDAAGNTATSSTTCTVTIKKRAFVLNPPENDGNFGGLTGGDALCQTAASGASLSGTWKAWLSDSNTDARERIANVGPWFYPDQSTQLTAGTDPSSGGLLAAIDRYQDNTPAGTNPVWTGTLSSGVRSPSNHCEDWTSIAGTANATDGSTGSSGNAWTDDLSPRVCDGGAGPAHLYCFEQ
jgi:hypothetical protein